MEIKLLTFCLKMEADRKKLRLNFLTDSYAGKIVLNFFFPGMDTLKDTRVSENNLLFPG